MDPLPIACTLQPGELAGRGDELLPGLIARAESIEETENGWRARFRPSGDILTAIARVVDAERQCCRFLEFRVTVAADGGPITLEMIGPAGTKEFLADLWRFEV